jgi:hypothetical protein
MEEAVKIKYVLDTLEEFERAALTRVIAKFGLTDEDTVVDVSHKIQNTPNWGAGLTMEERLSVFALYKVDNKFGIKLTYNERCQVKALHEMGIPRAVLAKMYNIDERTVSHIYNDHSPRYKNVKEEYKSLGPTEFKTKYLDQETMDKALTFQTMQEPELGNNKHANKKAGIHQVRNAYCTYDHRVAIQWREPDEYIDVAGWYYRDLDGDMPERWLRPHNKPESARTSQACFAAMLNDIADKMT